MRRAAGKRVLAGLAVVGIMVVSGLMAAWGVSPGDARAMSPAQVIAYRFPTHWKDSQTTGAAPRPATFALASVAAARADGSAFLFDPHPTWTGPAAGPAEPAPTVAATVASEPKNAEPKAQPVTAAPVAEQKPAPQAHAKPVVVASRSLAPVRHPHPPKDSGVMFNDAQLASIKARLKLTDYQEQYWPAVAAALRALGERAAHAPVRVASAYAGEGLLAGIDPDGPEVEQLKSAAFPLIMSMSYEQKDQVRTLARMMGLEQVASSF
jgi:outer membrane biosynthesis protein TonB